MSRAYWWIAIALTVTAGLASAALFPALPDELPIHWNIHGQVDGNGAKAWAAFLGPIGMLAMLILFTFLPWLSPKHFEVGGFRPTYLSLMTVLVALLGHVHALALMCGLREDLDVSRRLIGGIFLFFLAMGNVLGRVRRNFYIGIRVPWTLANERVWNETHRVAAWMLVASGLLGFVLVLARVPLSVVFAMLLVAILVPVIFSLPRYKELERHGEI